MPHKFADSGSVCAPKRERRRKGSIWRCRYLEFECPEIRIKFLRATPPFHLALEFRVAFGVWQCPQEKIHRYLDSNPLEFLRSLHGCRKRYVSVTLRPRTTAIVSPPLPKIRSETVVLEFLRRDPSAPLESSFRRVVRPKRGS